MIRLSRPVCPNPNALKNNYHHASNKEVLRKACFDKCMYCESKISHVYYDDVEHIKPKSKFQNLKFIWENLGYVCAKCNRAKGDKFFDELPFVNPFEEDPSNFFIALGPFIYHRSGNERGEVTLKEIALNRPELIERRHERIQIIQLLLDKVAVTKREDMRGLLLRAVENEVANDKAYSFVAKRFSQCCKVEV